MRQLEQRSESENHMSVTSAGAIDELSTVAAPDNRIIVDIDSTAWNLLDAMDRIAAHGDVTVPGPGTISYATVESWEDLIPKSGGLENMLKLFDRAFDAKSMQAIGLFPGYLEAMQAFKDAGLALHHWSDRPDSFQEPTRQVMEQFLVPADEILVRDRFDKIETAKQLGITRIIDDKPSTIEAAVKAGMDVFSLRYRYNADVIARYGIPHATSWSELCPMVLETVSK